MLINAGFNDKWKYINGILYFVLKRKLYSQASAVRATWRGALGAGWLGARAQLRRRPRDATPDFLEGDSELYFNVIAVNTPVR